MTDKDIIERWLKGRLADLYEESQCEVPELPKEVIEGKMLALRETLSFIDTLEVKEVDLEHLEQEVKDFCYEFDDRKDKWYDMTPHDKNIMISPTWSNFAMQLAKHFFVLGFEAAQKGAYATR